MTDGRRRWAISFQGTDDDLRSSLVQINERYPIATLEEAAMEYLEKRGDPASPSNGK